MMSSVHRAVAVRATLLLVLALVCGTCVLPAPAGPLPQPQQPRLQHAASAGPAAPTSSYETAYAAGGEADAPRGSVVHRDRRRVVTAPAGPPGPPPLTTRTALLTEPSAGRTGGPDTRSRPSVARDSSALQVFLC
ncbi:hypothetical protein OHB11_33375 [Streptomyces zaomyceticus]|uniref:hypothetical protein n=1 Tax=Streptomyces zaomyceticus TaxID=68286 RepID=UPI002E0FBDA5|nr:hypothetical protein OG237_07025 [Streptomyces zaomyceticus]